MYNENNFQQKLKILSTDDVYDLLHHVSEKFYGVDCSSCCTICCVEYAETDIDYCPQFDRRTHRCTVYNERPQACRIYPFMRTGKDILEIRKVGSCVITDKFLERFTNFCSNFEQDYSKRLKLELGEKKYYNRFSIPFHLVLFYLHYEFSKHNMKHQANDIMKTIDVL